MRPAIAPACTTTVVRAQHGPLDPRTLLGQGSGFRVTLFLNRSAGPAAAGPTTP